MRQFVICLVIAFYYWSAVVPSKKFDPNYNSLNYYNKLTTSLINGKTNLDVNVESGFFELKDPYDPILNSHYRDWNGIHDLSFYKGKFYLYFGVTPAILLYIPYRLITSKFLSDYFVVFIFMSGSFLLLSLLLCKFKDKYFHEIPEWVLNIFILVLGFSNLAGYMLRNTLQYQVSITGNVFCLSSFIWFLYYALNEENKKITSLILSSIFLGLSVGCRPQSIIIGIIVISLIVLSRTLNKSEIRVFVLPCTFVISVLGLYNYIRFDNPLEFGINYQLAVINFQSPGIHFYNPNNLLSNLYFNFFNPININGVFPFIHSAPIFLFNFNNPSLRTEKITGLFFLAPHFLFLLLLPKEAISQILHKSKKSILFIINFIPFIFGAIFSLVLTFMTLRYLTDFISFGLVCCTISFFYIYTKSKYKPILNLILIFFSLYSIICGFALGVEGCNYNQESSGLLGQDPKTYNALSAFFEPVSKLITSCKK